MCVCVYIYIYIYKGKERRKLILEEVREGVEVRYGKMVGLSQQGAWKRWEDVEKKWLHGQIVGGLILARFDFSLNQYMMCYRAQRTCTYGGRGRPLIVNCVLGKDLYNISLVVAQKL